MFFHSLFQKDATPVLRSMSQFTSKRHELLVQDIANVDTPYYRSKKLDLNAFQSSLRDAVDHRSRMHPRHFQMKNSAQAQTNSDAVDIALGRSSSMTTTTDSFLGSVHTRANRMPSIGAPQVIAGMRGGIDFRPSFADNEGIYRYDHTSGSIDKTMSDLAKNQLMGRTFGSLLAKKYRMLATAISERL